jgi:uncharacterized protein YcfJ
MQPAGVVEYGRITNVALVSSGTPPPQNPQASSAVGTALGGVLGGVLGHQVGSGSGNTAATILGAIGGAVAGNQLANRSSAPQSYTGPVYRVWVQTDSGQMRTYDVGSMGNLHPGDRVRIENGMIYLA